jgi:hypothetical protein
MGTDNAARYTQLLAETEQVNEITLRLLEMPLKARVRVLRALHRRICSVCGDYVGDGPVIDPFSGRGYCDRCDAR